MDDERDSAIMDGLTEIVRETFMDDDLVLARSTWAKDVVGWSSFSLVEIILGAQERFGVTLTAEETDGLQSIGDLADVIARKTK